MHIFLTGEIQCGKSTLIRRVAALLPQKKIEGCLTFSLLRQDGLSSVHIGPWGGALPLAEDPASMVGLRFGKGRYQAYPAVFEQRGVAILKSLGQGELIILDELGGMENEAPLFRQAVLSLLDGPVPVLGVIKPRSLPLPDAVRAHPRVEVLPVDVHNRELLPPLIAAKLFPGELPPA